MDMTSTALQGNSFMQAVNSAMDSKEIAVATTRILGFFSNSKAKMSRILPELPPIKAWVSWQLAADFRRTSTDDRKIFQ